MTTKEAAQLYRNIGKPAPADIAAPDASKYNARKKVLDGHVFDSTGEAEAYRLLRLWEDAGIIHGLELQKLYLLRNAFTDSEGYRHRAIKYRPDFGYTTTNVEGESHAVVVDFKGCKTAVYALKKKMFIAKYPHIRFEEWDRAKVKQLSQGIGA